MREARKGGSYYGTSLNEPPQGSRVVPYDEKTFFNSFYCATVRGKGPSDRNTIGAISEPESRFHYNVVENSIIRSVLKLRPAPRGAMIEAAQMLETRKGRRHLDIGSGTGHWIDFFQSAFFAAEGVAVEISDPMVTYLRKKYAGKNVSVLQHDVANTDTDLVEMIGGPVDFISAIGVMFHIVDDERWEWALGNLAHALKPDGLMFVGGEFGTATRNVQFHKVDEFGSWKEFDKAKSEEGVIRVNKRTRSLAYWHLVTARVGLLIVDVVRSDQDESIMTPENDVLVLKRS